MTVISAGVVNKQGRIVLARQFSEISRVRVEGLLSAFPRLLDASVNKQVTFIDAGSVRYVYQPLEELYLVLITSKHSNIVEDLATLHLMGRLIPEYVLESVTEAALESKTFQIFFAFDEVVVGGKRENTTVEQIHTFLEMDSHEERMALEAKAEQEAKAKRERDAHARELRERRQLGLGTGTGGAYSGIGPDSYAGFGSGSSGAGMDMGDSGSMGMGANAAPTFAQSSYSTPAPPVPQRSNRPGGMSLGAARKTDLTSKVQKEMGGGAMPLEAPPAPMQQQQQPQPTAAEQEGVHVVIEEKMFAALSKDGEQGPVTIKGELSAIVSDPQHDHIKLALAPVSSSFVFKAHAKINKALFASDHVLAMVNDKPFPVNQPVTILRWNSDTNSVQPPISFTCWPETGSITVEYELTNASAPPLEHVRLAIPLYGASVADVTPSVGTCEAVSEGFIMWSIPVIDGAHNSSGNIEIALADDSADASGDMFFPIDVSFSSMVSVGLVRVNEAISTQNGLPVRFSQNTHLITGSFQIQ